MTDQIVRRFEQPERAAGYDDRVRKIIPGYDILHQIVHVVLSAELPAEASVLVVGAGTGQELLQMSQAHSGWRFTAIEPAKPMADIAQEKLKRAGTADRVTWHAGTLEDFPGEDLFDAATLLMVLHLVSEEDQYPLLTSLSERLNPGAPFILADIFGDPTTTRYKRMNTLTKAWAEKAGLDSKALEEVFGSAPRDDFHVFTEERLKGWLKGAGFIDVQRIYQALRVGAWLARTNR
jgi:tRNA (cmo5U34)-methyltransferase